MNKLFLCCVLLFNAAIAIGCGSNPVGIAIMDATPEEFKTAVSITAAQFGVRSGRLTGEEKQVLKELYPEYASMADKVKIEINPMLFGSATGAVTGRYTIAFPMNDYRDVFAIVLHEYVHLIQIESIYGGNYLRFLRSYNGGAREKLEAECTGAEYLGDIVWNTPNVEALYYLFGGYTQSPDGFFRDGERVTFHEVALAAYDFFKLGN
jgi:hypothetical protein